MEATITYADGTLLAVEDLAQFVEQIFQADDSGRSTHVDFADSDQDLAARLFLLDETAVEIETEGGDLFEAADFLG